MSELRLEIITPEKEFFDGLVEAVSFSNENGELSVLPGHQTMISVISEGEIRFLQKGEWKSAYMAKGFAEVRPDETVIFTNYCDFSENIETARAHMKQINDEEINLHRKSIVQQKRNRIALTRALDDIKRKTKRMKNI